MSLISQAAKRLKTLLSSTAGAASVGFDAAASYAAGTVGAVLKTLSASVTNLQSQIAGILGGATFTGPVVLPGNAAGPLQAVPLQQMSSIFAEIPATVAAYAPPFVCMQGVACASLVINEWKNLNGGNIVASRGTWGDASDGSFTADAPGFIKVNVFGIGAASTSGVWPFDVAIQTSVKGVMAHTQIEVIPSGELRDMFWVIPVAVGEKVMVKGRYTTLGTVDPLIYAQEIEFEYFGPAT